jgi:hypothetical protein
MVILGVGSVSNPLGEGWTKRVPQRCRVLALGILDPLFGASPVSIKARFLPVQLQTVPLATTSIKQFSDSEPILQITRSSSFIKRRTRFNPTKPTQTTINMQLSLILSATMAVLVAAAPQGVTRRTDGSCNANSQQVCCAGPASCIVQGLDSTCSNEAYCCQNNFPIVCVTRISLF